MYAVRVGRCKGIHTAAADAMRAQGEDGELQRIRTYDLCDFIAPKKTQGSRKKKR